MSTWSESELATLSRIGEIRVAGRRADGTLRTPRIVWHVVVEGKLYIRSVRGADGAWYRGVIRHHEGAIEWDSTLREVSFLPDHAADDAIDQGYLRKYGDGSPSLSITNPTARATTLRVEPR